MSSAKIELVENPWETSKAPTATRFVCISDTHSRQGQGELEELPEADVLIHGGDFSSTGTVEQIQKFNAWLGTLPHRTKLVIAGNHELTLDLMAYEREWQRFHRVKETPKSAGALLTNCTYLHDSGTTVAGLNVWGSPWTPRFHDWAFNLDRGEPCRAAWAKIPDNTDILITHGPPRGILDNVVSAGPQGCDDLLEAIARVRPAVHIFGHIHEAYGVVQQQGITFINASTCNYRYAPSNPPVVFDVVD